MIRTVSKRPNQLWNARLRSLTIAAVLLVLTSVTAFAAGCADGDAELPGIISRMRDPSWEVRSKALYELIVCGLPPERSPLLFTPALKHLFESNPAQEDGIRAALIRLLETENQVVRQAEQSRQYFGEDYSNYYGDAIQAVAVINGLKPDPRSLEALIGAITTGNMAMNALAALGDPALARVQELAAAPRADVRSSAMFVLEQMLQPSHLEKMTHPADVRVRITAIFIKGIADEDASVRSAAASGLGALADRKVIPLLESLALHDPECFAGQKADDGSGDLCPVRLAARRALASLQARN